MQLSIAFKTYPIDGVFRISRDAKTSVEVVEICLSDGLHHGYGECRPYGRYGESLDSVESEINAIKDQICGRKLEDNIDDLLPAGAARNAVDCARWDLRCKKSGHSIWQLTGYQKPEFLTTAYTLGIDKVQAMADKAASKPDAPLLKIKLGSSGQTGFIEDIDRLKAIRDARTDARLIVDANEGWQGDALEKMFQACIDNQVELIEQPLPAGQDEELKNYLQENIKICADESLHTSKDLEALCSKYNAINIKLDKSGGLTEALKMVEKAKKLDYSIMCGCMLASSLSMAPAYVIGSVADVVDLDGPLLLAEDHDHAIQFEGANMFPPKKQLWG